jgi:hypothetical protein
VAELVSVPPIQVKLVAPDGTAVRNAQLPSRPSLPEIVQADTPDGPRLFVLERGLPDPLYRQAICVVLVGDPA